MQMAAGPQPPPPTYGQPTAVPVPVSASGAYWDVGLPPAVAPQPAWRPDIVAHPPGVTVRPTHSTPGITPAPLTPVTGLCPAAPTAAPAHPAPYQQPPATGQWHTAAGGAATYLQDPSARQAPAAPVAALHPPIAGPATGGAATGGTTAWPPSGASGIGQPPAAPAAAWQPPTAEPATGGAATRPPAGTTAWPPGGASIDRQAPAAERQHTAPAASGLPPSTAPLQAAQLTTATLAPESTYAPHAAQGPTQPALAGLATPWTPPTWPAPPWAAPVGGRGSSAAALENAARVHGADVDKFAEHAAAPTESMAMPPAPALRLAGVSADAAQLLRVRTRFVGVDASLSGAERGPPTIEAYVARVAELLAHRAYHFPGIGLQLTLYVAWLTRRSIGRDLADVRAADTKARELMATRPHQLMTAVDFDHVAELGPVPAPAARQAAAPPGSDCRNFREGRCQASPFCPFGRHHPPCRFCRSGGHHTAQHFSPVPRTCATPTRAPRR